MNYQKTARPKLKDKRRAARSMRNRWIETPTFYISGLGWVRIERLSLRLKMVATGYPYARYYNSTIRKILEEAIFIKTTCSEVTGVPPYCLS